MIKKHFPSFVLSFCLFLYTLYVTDSFFFLQFERDDNMIWLRFVGRKLKINVSGTFMLTCLSILIKVFYYILNFGIYVTGWSLGVFDWSPKAAK